MKYLIIKILLYSTESFVSIKSIFNFDYKKKLIKLPNRYRIFKLTKVCHKIVL